MPAPVRAPYRKGSKASLALRKVGSAPTRRKIASIEEPEVEAEVKEKEEPKTKKLKTKGKKKAQDEEVPASALVADKAEKEHARKEKTEVKEKKRKSEGKGKKEEKKTTVEKVGLAEARKEKSKATTKRKKVPTPSPKPSDAEEADEEEEVGNVFESGDEEQNDSGGDERSDKDVDEGDGEEGKEVEAPLHGFSSESDSSDEEDEDGVDKTPIDIGKLPTVAKDDATVKRKLEKAKKQATENRGVLYIGRIPHGFYEDQMRAYFSQFGDVTRLRLSRNKKTGRSRHFAFIEFKSSAVAQIVAETMDNYLLMGRLLQCKVVAKEQVHPELWIGANRKFRKVPMARLERIQQNKTRTSEERKKVERRLLKRQEQKKRKLEALGIDYDFGSVSYSKRSKQTA